MKRRILAGVVLVTSLFVMVGVANATQPDPEHKVTLCHATHSEGNPYVEESVDVASVHFEAHTVHQDGEDIIPAFGPPDYPFSFAGLNLDQLDILENGCNVPCPTFNTFNNVTPTTCVPPTTEPPTTETTVNPCPDPPCVPDTQVTVPPTTEPPADPPSDPPTTVPPTTPHTMSPGGSSSQSAGVEPTFTG